MIQTDIKTSVVESLDGAGSIDIYPFLSYLLQDIIELGTDPRLVEKIIRENIGNAPLRVLDLGCGKGAVSVHLASKLQCTVVGIDAMEDFLKVAENHARRQNVNPLCQFVHGDIRTLIPECTNFDMVILGAIGPVFGTIGETLKAVSPALVSNGCVILDDGYKPDGRLPELEWIVEKQRFYSEIESAGFRVLREVVIPANELNESNLIIQSKIVIRAEELIHLHPDKRELFMSYVRAQEEEIDLMNSELVTGVWLLVKVESSNDVLHP